MSGRSRCGNIPGYFSSAFYISDAVVMLQNTSFIWAGNDIHWFTWLLFLKKNKTKRNNNNCVVYRSSNDGWESTYVQMELTMVVSGL